MKKVFFVLCGFVLFLISGCQNPAKNSPPDGTPQSATAGMMYIGDIHKVYSAGTGSRYVTGQVIENFMGKTVRFEGNLVEYNSIKQVILEYVEGLESNNALMHQHYSDVNYDSTKKYVEFSSYTNVTTDKIVAFEIRVFYGNFLETYQTDGWYAKSVMFNPSFTKDIENNVTVDFGEPLDIDADSPTEAAVQDLIPIETINAIGSAHRIYSSTNSSRYITGQTIVNFMGKTVRFQGNLVEYTDVKKAILDQFINASLMPA